MNANWWRNAVIYQIYPRSFTDSNNDGLGDLPGVTQRMGYLAELGVDAIWLSPFYPSPLADGGYDVADYRAVDPRLGTLDDFDDMVQAAHAVNIKVLVDIVPNHTSEQHPWFQQALRARPGDAARERYIFRAGKGEHGELPPTNWQAMFGGSAWQRLADGQWYLHLFTPEQPDLNWHHPDVREDFLTTLRFWSDRGVDGFRIDVAHGLCKDLSEPLRDIRQPDVTESISALQANQDHPCWDQDEVHDIYRSWHAALAEYQPPRMTVAEAWVPTTRRALYTRPDELSQAFNFDLLRCPWDATAYRAVIDSSLAAAQQGNTASTWVLSNHDVVRHATKLGLPNDLDLDQWLAHRGQQPTVDAALGLDRARAATMLSLALPGSAYLYQGEELGLPEVYDLPDDQLQDPIYLRTHGQLRGRDGCRVPMPWQPEGPSLGFSTRPGWLPQPAYFSALSVICQQQQPASTLNFYKRLIMLRKKWMDDEQLRWLPDFDPTTVLAFVRGQADITVIVNTGDTPVQLPGGDVLLSSKPITGPTLPGNTAIWLKPDHMRHRW